MSGRRIVCRCCGEKRPHAARDLCKPCWARSADLDHPDVVPPPLARAEICRRGAAATAQAGRGRRDDYYWLRDEQGLTREQAAERMGVTLRSTWRWDALRREAVNA